jgi:hypothetical protein
MDDAAVLNIRAFADLDIIDIATDHGRRPDTGMSGQAHIAHHDGVRRDESGRIDLRWDGKKARAMGCIHWDILQPLRFFVQFPLSFCYKRLVNIFALPKTAALAVILLACPSLAQANIGDDIGQLRGRYGSAKNMMGQMLFQHDGYSICVYFDGAHSAMEIFVRDGSVPAKTDITQDDIDKILAAQGNGQPWNSAPTRNGKPAWVSADHKLVARLSEGDKPEDKVLTIMANEK